MIMVLLNEKKFNIYLYLQTNFVIVNRTWPAPAAGRRQTITLIIYVTIICPHIVRL